MAYARSSLALAAAAALAAHTVGAWAQGALKPVEALIVNPDSRPVPVKDTKSLQPYQYAVQFTQASCPSGSCQFTFPAVPAGKRLVVTHAGGRFSLPTDQVPFFDLASSSAPQEHLVAMLPQTAGPPVGAIGALRQYYVANGPVTMYVAAGAAPVVRLGGFGVDGAIASVVGHLIDAP